MKYLINMARVLLILFNLGIMACGFLILLLTFTRENVFAIDFDDFNLITVFTLIITSTVGLISTCYQKSRLFIVNIVLLVFGIILNVNEVLHTRNNWPNMNEYHEYFQKCFQAAFGNSCSIEQRYYVDLVQIIHRCCGYNSFSDYPKNTENQLLLPESCCSDLSNGVCDPNDAHKTGCLTKFIEFSTQTQYFNFMTKQWAFLFETLVFILIVCMLRKVGEINKKTQEKIENEIKKPKKAENV